MAVINNCKPLRYRRVLVPREAIAQAKGEILKGWAEMALRH